MALISLFWILFELSRPLREAQNSPIISSFLGGGFCSAGAWAVAYPLDSIKSRAQGHLGPAPVSHAGKGMWIGAYKGFGFGMARTVLANGCAMIVYDAIRASLTTRGAES